MPDYGERRNADGYLDLTPYRAMKEIRPGEIWTYGKECYPVLIIANQGTFCNALRLIDEAKDEGSICVNAGNEGDRFTHPAMIQYIYNDSIKGYLRRLPLEEFEDIKNRIGAALGIPLIATADDVDILKLKEDVRSLMEWKQAVMRGVANG